MAIFWPTVKPDVLVTGTLVEPVGIVITGPSGRGCHSGVLALAAVPVLTIVAVRPLPDKSSTVALRNGSAPNCERPIQFWLVLPRFDGCRVMFGLVATGAPLRYSVPVVPDSVTATCDQVFSGNSPPPVSCCSPLPVVIANRRPAPPPSTVRNMYVLVPVPKSNTRDQVASDDGLTQADTVKSDRPLTIPLGRLTYSPPPLSLTALPILPATRGPVAPLAGMSLIVAASVLPPLSITIGSPTFIPVVLLTLTVVSPALAGAASPELDRPSRQWPPAASVVPAGTAPVEKTACWAGCSVSVQWEMSTALAPAL